MTLYNITRILSNSTNYLTLTQNINDAYLNGFLGIFILLGTSAVFFWSFFSSTKNVPRTITATGFISFILSFVLYMIGLLNEKAILICMILFGLALAFTWKQE